MIFTAMRKTKNLFILSSLLVLVLGISSCSDFDNGYTSKDIAYKEQFYNMFGNADPNHTWNMAQSRSLDVTINSEGTYTVKVWTANPRLGESNAFLLGQYDRVPGGATSSFACDMPQDVKTAYVGIIDENGDRIILPSEVKDGKVSVEFGALGTRTAFSGSSGSITYTAIDKSNGKEFQKGDMDAPLNTLPEQQQNIGKVSQDFEYVSTGEFTIYPMYSVTGNAGSDGKGERLGIYLVDENGNKGDVVWIWQSTVNDGGTTGTATWFDGYNNGLWETDFFGFSTDRKQTLQIDNPKVVWGGNNFVDPYTAIRAEGITVNIPEGTRFGMVLDASGGGPYYSNSAYNKDQGWPFPGKRTESDKVDGVNDVYAATFEYQGRLYLAFEDWNYDNEWHDCDFNDVVFVMPETTKKPIVIDKDTKDVSMSYIVACEDLGGTFDWDFNDVVYAIEHVSGQQKAKLKLLAAGGTLPVKISYDGSVIRFNGKNGLCEDLHEAFGVDQKTPVNVGGYSASPVYSEEFEVGADAFSMSTHASAFKIHVKYSETLEVAQIGVPDRSAGQEPQAFLVADPNWKWPNEKVSITSVYPEFTEWVADLNKNWCGSVWGDEGNGTSTTGNVIDVLWALEYSGNEATFPLNANQMNTYTSYQIVLQTSANATVKFFDASPKEIQMTDGNVQAGQQSTFTLSGEALNALKGGKMTITFPDGQAADGRVTKLDWVEGTELASGNQEKTKPTFEVSPTSLTFEPENWAPQHITPTTNSTGAVTYKSMNTDVATIDGNGNVKPVAGGKTYLVANLSETDEYYSATAYITVEVKEKELVKDEWFTNGNFAAQGTTMNWVADPTNSENGCVKVASVMDSLSYATQFFVSIPENESPLKEGDKYRLTMKVRADVAQTIGSQSQSSPGTYIHYDAGVGNIDVTGEWVTITKEITVTSAMSPGDNMRTIAFDLANRNQANNFYFDDVKIEIISRANLQDPNLNLNNSTLSMYVNDTQSVGFSKNGNGAISVACSDNTVASAALDGSNIKITGLKAGTTTITVRLDAEGNYKTVKKTIEVTVSERPAGTPTPVSATIATDTPQHGGQSITGNWYKLSAAEMYAAVGNNDSNGVILEFKLHNSGVTSFYMGNNENCKMFVLKDGNDDVFHSVNVWGKDVTVQWNGEYSEVDGIPARTLIVTIPDQNLWINGVVGYDNNNNTYNKDLYFGGGLGNEYVDGTVSVTVTPVN